MAEIINKKHGINKFLMEGISRLVAIPSPLTGEGRVRVKKQQELHKNSKSYYAGIAATSPPSYPSPVEGEGNQGNL